MMPLKDNPIKSDDSISPEKSKALNTEEIPVSYTHLTLPTKA